MKKKIIIILITVVLIISLVIYIILTRKEKIYINEEFLYNTKVYLNDIIDTSDRSEIDTLNFGNNTYKYETKDKIYIINYNVIDNVAPKILGSDSFTIEKGNKIDLVNKQICVDNYDNKPNCYVEGDYDLNTTGEYNIKYIAIDSSNNKNEKDIKLIVKDKISSSNNSSKNYIQDIINMYKNDNTSIGIDVSSWQGEINFNKVKDAGIEFVMIRIGFGYNRDNELVYDTYFRRNLTEAKKAGLKVGLYFYSYAKNKTESINQAKWIINELNGEILDLGIAFDWEDWSDFNNYNFSLKDINDVASSFINEINKNNYNGYLYSSAYYLNNIWDNYNNVWLAHYTKQTTYEGNYNIWQLTNTGIVNGIDGYVDLNILYKNNID